MLSSCKSGERSYEDNVSAHGAFFFYVLEGMRGHADGNKNGRVSLLEL